MSKGQTCCMKFLFLLTISELRCCADDARLFSLDTLKQGDTLKYPDVIISASTAYRLEFGEAESSKYYLRISFSSIVVWVANRDTPILDDSGTLTIDHRGTLMIKQRAGNPIVLYSDNGAASSTTRVATLHDNGNLVFSELHSNGSIEKILWQSFDHPTDTLLPGMLLGTVDDKRVPRLSLISWLKKSDPSSGAFTLHWDPKEQRMTFRRRGFIVWKGGIHMLKSFWPYITPVVSSDGNSFSYSANSTAYLKLSEGGSLIFEIDNSRADQTSISSFDITNMCYGYNDDNGCVKWSQPNCRSDMPIFKWEKNVWFLKADSNETDLGVRYTNASLVSGDCRTICWEDCDCVAYDETEDDNDIGCLFWKGNSQVILNPDDDKRKANVLSASRAASPSPSLPPQPSPSVPRQPSPSLPRQPSTAGHVESESKKSKSLRRRWILIAMLLLLASSLSLILITVTYWSRWKRRGRHVKGDPIEKNTISVDRDELENNLKVFNFQCLSEATNNFSLENKLGEGGFGPVYKGTLPEGNEIAVKRLSRSSSQGIEELKNELKLIAKLQHVNLVHLLGYCIQGEEKMLIYEYMPNKSLDYILFDPSKRCLLDCTTRLNIIEGIGHGLLYLHEYSRLMIIHRDLKASNILLDASLNPKISDFGMAKIFKRNELMANTERIVGTLGYMPPEYAMEGKFSVKSDVYSFGILILEIVSGRRNNSFYDSDRHINLIGYAWELWKKDGWTELVDPALKESCSMNQLHRIIHVGLLCVEDLAENRPTVSEVISMLSNVNLPLPSVKRPAFLIWNSSTKKQSQSINGMSLSSIAAR